MLATLVFYAEVGCFQYIVQVGLVRLGISISDVLPC